MKKIHLAWFGSAAPNVWNKPAGTIYDWRKPDIWQDVARLCERAKFDMVLFADTLSVPKMYGGNHDWNVRNGFMIAQDPLPLLTLMGAATTRLGVASTLSSTFYPPFLLARLLATLDHLTSGRIGWNVVTTSSADAAANFGLEKIIPHDERYDMADEYLELCRRLWDSWEPDAVVLDRAAGVFADPRKVHEVNFVGQYYRSRGPLNVVSSPQRHPVIIMAGTSPRGQAFAVKNADMVIAHKNSVADMRLYATQLRAQLEAAGRDPASCKIFFSLKPVMGETPDQAQENWSRNYEKASVEAGLSYLSSTLGIDMAPFDLDKPLPPDLPVQGIVGKLLQYTQAKKDMPLREIAKHEAMHETFPICGTPAQVADVIEQTAAETGADGFHFRAKVGDYGYLTQIATGLMPILQARGLARTGYAGATLRENLFAF